MPPKIDPRRAPNLLFRVALVPLVAAPASFGLALISGVDDRSFVIDPGEVGLILARGEDPPSLVTRAGKHRARAPFERARVIDVRPQRILFGVDDDPDGAPALRVRSTNGSSFTLDGLELHWRVDADLVGLAVEEGGSDRSPAQGARVRGLASAILRDAFGAFDSEAVADARRVKDALDVSKARLDEVLRRHGLELVQLVAPRPRFDREYEHAIEQRQLLELEAERLSDELADLPRAVVEMREKTSANHALAEEVLSGELVNLEASARAWNEAHLEDARRYAANQLAKADAERSRLEAEAATRSTVGRAEAASLAAQVDAYEEYGPAAVREHLVDRLARVRFEIASPAPREEL